MGKEKSGIDFFLLDVHLDGKFELLEAETGLKGFGVVVKLLQRIYGCKGYYTEWTTKTMPVFSRWVGLKQGSVVEIVNTAIRCGIFDKGMYEKYQILTSAGIQKRYFEAVQRRKSVEVEKRYLLVEVAQICPKVQILTQNVNISKQSREEKNKEYISSPLPPPAEGTGAHTEEQDALFNQFWTAYPRKVAKKDAVKAWRRLSPDAETAAAILSAVEAWRLSAQWTHDGGQYIPYPATFLNRERWRDTPPPAAPAKGASPLPSAETASQEELQDYERAVSSWRPVYKGGANESK